MEEKLYENERLDDLQYKGLKIIQNKKQFCFGIDAVLLSNFVKSNAKKNNNIVFDLCTGNGIIAILLSKKINAKKIIGIEIQQEVCELANRNVLLNKIQNIIEIHNKDIKELLIEKNNYEADIVVVNPPYKKENTGKINETTCKKIAKHEIMCNLQDVIKVGYKLLKYKGKFFMVHRAERLSEIIEYLKENDLEPKNIQFVHSKKGEKATLVLIEATKKGKEFVNILPPLIIYNDDNSYTEQIKKIYKEEGD